MKFKVLIIYFLLSLILSQCCCQSQSTNPEGFSLFGKGNYDGQFRIDGIYVFDERRFAYFYNDGTYLEFGLQPETVNDWMKQYQLNNKCFDISEFEHFYDRPDGWGAYMISNDKVQIQVYRSGDFGCYNNQVFEFNAIIKNSTSLIFQENDSREYRFKQCDNKPDSLNPTWR